MHLASSLVLLAAVGLSQQRSVPVEDPSWRDSVLAAASSSKHARWHHLASPSSSARLPVSDASRTSGAAVEEPPASQMGRRSRNWVMVTNNENYTLDPLRYRGGFALTGQVNVFVVWYGVWPTATKQVIIDFLNGLPRHPIWGLLSQYSDLTSIGYAGGYDDLYDNGLNINGKAGNQSTDVISAAIRSGKLPQIPNALYAVLTDVKSSTTDLCSDGVCAWHFMSNFADGSPYNVVDIPAPAICNCGTGLPDQLSPNRDANVDALVTNLWHEIAEAVTDPDCGGGWYDASSGLSGEIADKCDLYYGPTFVNSTLSYNVDMPWRVTLTVSSYLDNNQFTGALPAWLSNTPEQSLNLSHNQFSGTIPALLGLNYAQTIDLSYNRLVGPIPDGLSYLVLGRNLRELDIQGNLINGTIPPAFKDVTLNYDKSKLSFAKSNTKSTVPQQCSHDPCTIGGTLDPFCSPCIRNVTAQDAFCGTVYWDVLCVSEVTSICGISCV
ncbi:hypothetical protein HK101_004261, partial [Irineochytrium annulatum]